MSAAKNRFLFGNRGAYRFDILDQFGDASILQREQKRFGLTMLAIHYSQRLFEMRCFSASPITVLFGKVEILFRLLSLERYDFLQVRFAAGHDDLTYACAHFPQS